MDVILIHRKITIKVITVILFEGNNIECIYELPVQSEEQFHAKGNGVDELFSNIKKQVNALITPVHQAGT